MVTEDENSSKQYMIPFDLATLEETIERDEILDVVTEEEIFGFYVSGFKIGKVISSPIRRGDENPSFNIFKAKDSLRYKDFATGESGDCFDFVQRLLGVSFKDALRIIYTDLEISNKRSMVRLPKMGARLPMIGPQPKTLGSFLDNEASPLKTPIIVIPQAYTQIDKLYWAQYGITLGKLNEYNVSSAKEVYISSIAAIPLKYNMDSPIYDYKFGKTREAIRHKIYLPFEKDRLKRWKSNCSPENVQGLEQLATSGNLLIITKALKDVMCLSMMGLNSVAPQSENTMIPGIIMADLIKRFKNIMVLYDYDQAGLDATERMCKTHNTLKSSFIRNIGTKDISDYTMQRGHEEARKLIKGLIDSDCLDTISTWGYITQNIK